MTKNEIEQEMSEVIIGLECRDELETLNCKSAYIAGRMAGSKDTAALMIKSLREDEPIVAHDGSC